MVSIDSIEVCSVLLTMIEDGVLALIAMNASLGLAAMPMPLCCNALVIHWRRIGSSH